MTKFIEDQNYQEIRIEDLKVLARTKNKKAS